MDTTIKEAKPRFRFLKIAGWVFLFFLFYIVTVVPVGMFVYTQKNKIGLNVFTKTGFHSFMGCLQSEAKKVEWRERRDKGQPVKQN